MASKRRIHQMTIPEWDMEFPHEEACASTSFVIAGQLAFAARAAAMTTCMS